jgi:hypothetical protein
MLSGCGLCCLTHMGKRQALRDRFGLPEDCNDCVATTFCASCAICQEARELQFRVGSSRGIYTYKDFVLVNIYSMILGPVVLQPMNTNVSAPLMNNQK